MKCAIMQPTYIPWSGYFNMIASVDVFIFLDDVQFNKRSWQQRNRIMVNGSEKFVTVPVSTKGKREQLINEVETDETQSWRKGHQAMINHAYAKHPYGQIVSSILDSVLSTNCSNLSAINRQLIEVLMDCLEIKTKIMLSSQISVSGKKSEYLLRLCDFVGADKYLSAKGSQEYIEYEGLFNSSTVVVEYHDFLPFPYRQSGSGLFIPYLSIVDLIANVGPAEAKNYILRT